MRKALYAFTVVCLMGIGLGAQGGSFIPSLDYSLSGLWTFTGSVPVISNLGGVLVGSTATQTLTNKTLTAPTLTTAILTAPVVTHPVATYTADGAVAVTPGVALLQKAGSAAAMTLAAPGTGGIGQVIMLTTTTDFAHVVTFTGGTLWDGTAGANSTWTAAAVQGSSLTIVGISATKWNVVAFNLGTIAP